MIKPSLWAPDHVAPLERCATSVLPQISGAEVIPVTDHVGLWDAWPIQHYDGAPVSLAGGTELWMALGAPRCDHDPDARHQHARIHLLQRRGQRWDHLGLAMPDGFSPGSREWSGSAVLDPTDMTVTLYFTAVGRRGEAVPSFEQRMFAAVATLVCADGPPRLAEWRSLREILALDPQHYMPTGGIDGEVGKIKAFRDPGYFRDPASGQEYLLFAGSVARSQSTYNGAVGIARRSGSSDWELCPPLVSADGLNNELERPHVVHHAGLYYLFWSTQRHVFNPDGVRGPTGLYGMVSSQLLGGWKPLNGSGLVFANPERAPAQAYSWLVLPDHSVASFVDNWGGGPIRRFGGTFAPFVRIGLSGERAWLQGLA